MRLGSVVSGVITEVGPNATGAGFYQPLNVGDEVIGYRVAAAATPANWSPTATR